MLEPKTIEILLANGWYPGYSYDVTQAKANLIENGFQPHDAALEFLKKYGGLVVVVRSKADAAPYEACSFEISTEIFDDACLDDAHDYGMALGAILCPVGISGNRHSTVNVAENGQVYSHFNPYISLLGRSFDEAMNCLCQRTRPLKRGIYEIEGIRWEW